MSRPFRRSFLLPLLLLAGWAASGTCLADLKEGLAQFGHGDYAQAIATLKPVAEHGDASAQYALGLANYNHLGTARNLPEALKWFRLAAAQGMPEAQFCLAEMYAQGEGVPADQKIAVSWFQRAAWGGHGPSFYNLGVHYAQGSGVGSDLTTALAHMMVAADLGVAEAVDKRDELIGYLGPAATARARSIAIGLKIRIIPAVQRPLPSLDTPPPQQQPKASTVPIQN